MFTKWFARKSPYVELQTSGTDIRLMGEPVGNGLSLLTIELEKILAAEANASKAYLTKVQYAGEDRIRLAVVIDGRAPAKLMAGKIAKACESLAAIDLLFFESLPSCVIDEVEKSVQPFFVAREA
jgi:hypothetical protein